jgi:predicted membrane-bound dolichyl-phosphate-mannose-protein mannosyltransferase
LISTPLVLLAVVSVASLGARAALLGQPCQSPCNKASDHTLVFDEAYYVNAARVIAGIRPASGQHYSDAPLGTDPNAEHPQGVKLVMAAAIELFGDGPFAWRIGSLIFGSIAILGMYALVRSAGGGPWSALSAATLMACDNLLLVHGRIGTLDIYAVAMMIWAVAFYLWRRPMLAGLTLAVGTAFKEVAPYALIVVALLEIARVIAWRRRGVPVDWRPRAALVRFGFMAASTALGFIILLTIMDSIATPYADATAQLINGGPFAEIAHIISYASQQTSPNGPKGIASYPWAWLIDLKPITYLRINPSIPGHGLFAIHPVSKFLGMISPPILFAGMLGLLFACYRLVRPRALSAPPPSESPSPAPSRSPSASIAGQIPWDSELPPLAVAWFLGTWSPFALASLIDQRTSYLYYMVIVMPGLYIAATYLVSSLWRLRRRWVSAIAIVWGIAVVAAVVLMYPFVPVF